MNPSRRMMLTACAALSTSLFGSPDAWARRRPRYTGSVQLHLPLNVTSIDPHDPRDLTATLLGSALFETLYAASSPTSFYPTLTTTLPKVEKGRCLVELRPGLRFASGRTLDAAEVVASLDRAKKFAPWLESLGTIRSLGGSKTALTFSQTDPQVLARLLSSPRAALVPRDFSPTAPDTCGAFQVERSGRTLVLKRNPRAPRGGAFLDEVRIESASVSDCLRAFEARRSDLGFLGAGLHRERKDVERFSMQSVGLALLLPGRELRARTPVGTLHEVLARLPQAPLSALGIERPRHAARRWNGDDVTLVVPAEEPWLIALAEEMESALSTKDHEVVVKTVPKGQIPALERSEAFDLLIQFFSTQGVPEAEATRELFRLDKRPAPRGGRTLPPLESGRQLSLGVVGTMSPRGALSPEVTSLIASHSFSLERAQRRP